MAKIAQSFQDKIVKKSSTLEEYPQWHSAQKCLVISEKQI